MTTTSNYDQAIGMGSGIHTAATQRNEEAA